MAALALSCLAAGQLSANTLNLSQGDRPYCSTAWSVSGTTYTCLNNGQVLFDDGDTLIADTDVTIVANNGFSISNNTIGDASNRISLTSTYGTVDATGSNTIFGNLQTQSGTISLGTTDLTGNISTSSTASLTNSLINGNITASNGITTNNTEIKGSATSNNGSINLTGGSVEGKVTSTCCNLVSNNTDLMGGAEIQSGMELNGGSLAGDFIMTSSNPATLTNVNMVSGSLTGASTITANNSVLGSPSDNITLTSTTGPVTLNNSTAYGDLTAPSYSEITIQPGSDVFGTCDPDNSNCAQRADETTCSAYIGQATINEVHRQGNNTRFMEVKILNFQGSNALDSSVYSQWTLSYCSSQASPCQEASLSDFNTGGLPWLVLPREQIPNQNYIDFGQGGGNGMEIRLNDQDGKAIDYLSVAGYTSELQSGCDFVYDTTYPSSTNSQTLGRQPDGTGNWAIEGPGGSSPPTEGESNIDEDDANPLPRMDISGDSSVTPGDEATFTITLKDRDGLQRSFDEDIVFEYTTQDGDGSAGASAQNDDYTETSGQETIPAGEENAEITVETLGTAAPGSYFYLRIVSAEQTDGEAVVLTNHFASATFADTAADDFLYLDILFSPSVNALTCEPLEVTFRACSNEDCTETYDNPVAFAASPSSGWSSGNIFGFTGETSDIYRRTSAGSVNFGVLSFDTAPPSGNPQVRCNGSTNPDHCQLQFFEEGLLLVDSSLGTVPADYPQPNSQQVAGSSMESLVLRAVRQDPDQAGEPLEPLANTCVSIDAPVDREIQWSAVTLNPETPFEYDSNQPDGHVRVTATVSGTPRPIATHPLTDPSLTTIEQSFNSEGISEPFSLQYDDAGAIQLRAHTDIEFEVDIDGTTETETRRVQLINGNHTFWPDKLVFAGIYCDLNEAGDCHPGTEPDGDPVNNPGAADHTGSPFAYAGAEFVATVQVLNAQNDIARNFGQEFREEPNEPALTVNLTAELLHPNNDAHEPSLDGQTTLAEAHFEAGSALISLRWPEVGIIELTAELFSYLEHANGPTDSANSEPVGRFIPAYFALSNVVSTGNTLESRHAGAPATNAQGNFTYIGQPFSFGPQSWPYFSLEPRTVAGSPISNYYGDFFRFDTSEGLNRNYTSTEQDSRFSPDVSGGLAVLSEATADDYAEISLINDAFSFDKMPTPLAPFTPSITLTVPAPNFDNEPPSRGSGDLLDDDGVCFREAFSEDCSELIWTIDSPELLDGRLRLRSAQGPFDQPLRMEADIQYWDGESYVALARDSDTFTPIPLPSALNDPQPITPASFSIVQSPAATTISDLDDQGSDEAILILAGINRDNYPQGLRRTIEGTDIPEYLRADWNNEDALVVPRAIASFGTYEGRPPLLFMLQQGR